jgi:hypothetical protein
VRELRALPMSASHDREFWKRISKLLRDRYDPIVHTPLPQGWVDLIVHPDDEGANRRRSAQSRDASS